MLVLGLAESHVRGPFRREVRNWVRANVRRPCRVGEHWVAGDRGGQFVVPMIAFACDEDAALFRLSWL